MKFRDLTPDDIECRIQQLKKNGLILLLYKNARVDMNILDEAVGTENWQREHYECKGNLFCKVGILFPEIGWVWKSDCGTESNTEAEKGEASDSFKRACFNWGIGRELYTAPFIWVPVGNYNVSDGKCYDRFYVDKIEISGKKIVGLQIINANTQSVVFSMRHNAQARTEEKPKAEPKKEKQESTPVDQYLNFVIPFGKYKDKTVKQMYKEGRNDVAEIRGIALAQGLNDVVDAIDRVESYIASKKK